ncbi:hypothetical protein HFP15_31605 [Amycolatopsis sp. K13G38]|uniref:Uncharacterized protein n=1 Tax=Amycolatopsis acididurans TaxID=2724524 RepID=A0ABX1JCA2_9PSEU|nr:hypothetical protein [Amycolatopsis acididurans]NKQ57420.1 hypothetical protein [Amycolatopsis acididurans]
MGRHRFEDKDRDKWGGPELAERKDNVTRHSRDADGRDPAVPGTADRAQPDAGKK